MTLKTDINILSQDKLNRLSLRLAFIFTGLQLIIIALTWNWLPPELPLLYSRPYGENQLINSWQVWFLPLGILIVETLSIRLAVAAAVKDKLWSQMILWAALIMSAMALVTLLKIIWLVL